MSMSWFMRIWLAFMASLLGGLLACAICVVLGLGYEGFFMLVPMMLASAGVTYWWFGKRFQED